MTSVPEKTPNGESARSWLSDPRVGRRIFQGLLALGVLLGVADFFYPKTAHHEMEGWPAFHAVFGFVAFVVIVLASKLLRRIIWRDEGYYDD